MPVTAHLCVEPSGARETRPPGGPSRRRRAETKNSAHRLEDAAGSGGLRMLEVLVLKIEDPDCFWVVIKGCSPFLDHEVDYQKLNSAMNDFYNSRHQNTEIKPLILEEGQVCVVYCQELKSWCRAVIKSIILSEDHYLAKCFLVDFAKYIPVKSKNEVESVYYSRPAKKWDSAAIQYFQNILRAATEVQAKLCAVEDDTFEVYLYVTIKNVKVCVNDDLVAKNFACYVSPRKNEHLHLEEATFNIKSESFSSKLNPALTLWPMLLQRKDFQGTKNSHGLDFLAQSLQHTWCKGVAGDLGPAAAVLVFSSLKNVTFQVSMATLSDQSDTESKTAQRLLQFLNPDPLRADGISDLQQLQKLKSGTQQPVMVLRHKIEPCLTIDSSPLSADLKKPLVIIVCPGWKKAQLTFELLGDYSMSSRPLHPMFLTIGLHKDEAKNMKLPRGCDVIVTTPHNLLRLLEYQSLLFLRVCHLVLDEVEVLFSEANEQMFAILDNFKKNVKMEERESAPRQIIAVGVHWNRHIEHLMREFMSDPYVVITAPEEAALYGNIQQVVHLCLECEKTSTLLQVLDFIPSRAQKTLIFTCSAAETEIVSKVVESNSIFCLKMHKEMVFDLKNVLEQWKKLSSGSHIVLALTDDCIPLLAITDATCVIHFSFPSSPKFFGGRLYCMSDHFESLTEQGSPAEQRDKKPKSVLLLTEKNASQAVGVLRYLERADAKIPLELYEFTAGVLEAKEDKKANRPLCRYLKAFGFCKDKRICPDRHHINPETDMPRKLTKQALPMFGYIKIIPCYISNATNYFGRIIDKHVDLYATLNAEMNEYFKDSSSKTTVEKVEKFRLYGLEEKTSFHRVQVLEMSPREDSWVLDSVLVKFIDEGRTGLVATAQLLHLPENFSALPPQAVEFIVCRVRPADNEIEWNPKVTRYIHHKVVGKLHDAKVVLALGNTVWIDPMVHVTKLSNLRTSVVDYNVRAEILSMGMGVDNSEHVEELKKLYKGAKMPTSEETLNQTP
ncbi:Tudor domain-containing protein 12 [Heterocephalus glaber]|uniref:RNA helicase n=1 Tax=Heterocephalus glaber TaxID=10181 RepID=G5BL30_HETGA|nr:Tudor domain-containing protein 12 [Heterocephalus glaber]